MRPQSRWVKAWQPGIAAIKAYWIPFVSIQILAVVLVLAYFKVEAIRLAANTLGEWKLAGGLLFAFCAGAIAGGLIAELAKALTGKIHKYDRPWLKMALFTALTYGFVGMLVDSFFMLQSRLFGNGTDIQTLAIKTAMDMLVFSTVLSIPFATVMMTYAKRGFSFKELWLELRSGFYRRRVIPGLLPCWAFWTPVVICTYSLPLALQLPFSQLAEAAWSVLFVAITTSPDKEEVVPADLAEVAEAVSDDVY